MFNKEVPGLEKILPKKFEKKESKTKEIPEELGEIEKTLAGIDEIYGKIKKISFDTEFMLGQAEKVTESMYTEVQRLMTEKQIPEIRVENLEKILNGFIKRGEEKYSASELGFIVSFLAKKSVEKYIEEEKAKGKKLEHIEPIVIKLNTRELKEPPNLLGYKFPEKIRLIINGNAGNSLGEKNDGGEIEVLGDAGDLVGLEMKKGLITIKGNARDRAGAEMTGGKIEITGNVGKGTAADMRGGELSIGGKVKNFSQTAFLKNNEGKIKYRGRYIEKRIESE